MPQPGRKITLKMLAEMAEVDISTVSRALSGDPRVRSETRERIQKLARKHNYRPNLAARHLVAGRTSTILFIISSFENRYEREAALPAAEILRESGYDLFTALSANDYAIEQRLLNRLRQGVADGALLIPGGSGDPQPLQELRRERRPLILIDRNVPGSGAPLVTTDNAAASAELVRLCHASGCRSFLIDFHHNNSVSRLRQSAAAAEVLRLGARLLTLQQATGADAPAEPWAVVSNSQADALTTLGACHPAWLQQPFYISVFDTWAGEPYPAQEVFVAVQDFVALGQQATSLLLQMLAHPEEDHADQVITVPAKEFLTIRRNF